jgi:hypothetical protein
MGRTGVKRKSGRNSKNYLKCKEWIEYEEAELCGALQQMDKVRDWMERTYGDK